MHPSHLPESSPLEDVHEKQRAQAAASCAGHLARTLKTCRLYEASNPTALRFRQELADVLIAWLREHGPFKLDFTAKDVLWHGRSLYPAKSAQDNLGMPFFREGMRSVTFVPGLEAREIDAFVDALLVVTSRASESTNDLVSILWDADLPHLDMTYVSAEADFDSGTDRDGPDPLTEQRFAWPGEGSGLGAGVAGATGPGAVSARIQPDGASGTPVQAPRQPGDATRSEDWIENETISDIERSLLEIEADADVERGRFADEWREEHTADPLSASIELVRAARVCGLQPEERSDLSSFLVRLLQEALSRGEWGLSGIIVGEMHAVTESDWDSQPMLRELAHTESVLTTRVVRTLDGQGLAEIQEFLEIARAMGPPASDWLMAVLAKSENRRTRQAVSKGLVELCRGHFERFAPWILDERWYVVRNVVQILGLIGDPGIANLLRPILHHSDPRVRIEIVRALEPLTVEVSRPLLLELLPGSQSRTLSAALHRLASRRDPEVARLVHAWMRAPEFRERSPDEQRAIYSALGSSGDDSLLPDLETDLNARGQSAEHCAALARCIARFGTPESRKVLERGAASRSGLLRQACRSALEAIGHA